MHALSCTEKCLIRHVRCMEEYMVRTSCLYFHQAQSSQQIVSRHLYSAFILAIQCNYIVACHFSQFKTHGAICLRYWFTTSGSFPPEHLHLKNLKTESLHLVVHPFSSSNAGDKIESFSRKPCSTETQNSRFCPIAIRIFLVTLSSYWLELFYKVWFGWLQTSSENSSSEPFCTTSP